MNGFSICSPHKNGFSNGSPHKNLGENNANGMAVDDRSPPMKALLQHRSIPIYSSSEVIEKMLQYANSAKEQSYRAMYSSLIGGITLDHALMVIPLDDHMVHRGHGVFDTAMLINGCIYDLDSHLDRFLVSAAKAKISPPFSRETLKQIILQLAASSKLKEGAMRYWLSAGPGDFSVSFPRCPQSAFYSIAIDKKFTRTMKGAKVVTSSIPMKPSMFATMKSVNYLPNVLSQLEAEERGAYACIWVDEQGYIAEGPCANIAIVSKSKELALPLSDKILSGCTSKRLSVLAIKLVDKGLLKSVSMRKVTAKEARNSAEMMFVSSLTHVAPIVEWDEQPIGDGRVGDLTIAISDLFWEDITEGPKILRTPVPYNEMNILQN